MSYNTLDSMQGEIVAKSRALIANVFSYMFAALAISGVVAWLFGHNLNLVLLLISETGFTPLGYIVLFAPVGLALLMQMAYNRLSIVVLLALYILYSVLIGASLGFIFLVYELGSIASVFAITAGTYGAMALLGYFTKTDLTKLGSILYMVFIGIFIASIVNIFMQSEKLDWIISIIGVFVFTGLTAYKMQEIKNWSQMAEYQGESTSKLALIFGLQMYILFINLFLTLLRLFGERK
jgi:FtsH-binding integral membrane protein